MSSGCNAPPTREENDRRLRLLSVLKAKKAIEELDHLAPHEVEQVVRVFLDVFLGELIDRKMLSPGELICLAGAPLDIVLQRMKNVGGKNDA